MAKENQVAYETRGPAAWICLDRPEKRNALSPGMISELGDALDRAADDDAVRAVVVTGRGNAFCAGADLDAVSDLTKVDEGPWNPFARVLRQMQTSAKPVIAAVNGPAFGGGLGLVAAADIVVASSEAVFSFSEVRLGLVPATISVVVLPRIGLHHARRLFLTGRRFSGEEAMGYGLVHRVTPAGELATAVAEEVADVAKGGPLAIAETKRLIREMPGWTEDEAYAQAFASLAKRAYSDEGRDGMAAFAEKRRPKWRS